MTVLPPDTPFPIAIDGPASSGKSSIGGRVAHDLGVPFLDTGLLYRAVGVALRDDRLDDVEAAVAIAQDLDTRRLDPARLASEAAGERASRVAVMAPVRQALHRLQRAIASSPGGAVLAGRDIGSAIVPDAPVKIFVTASVDVRAERRRRQLLTLHETVIHSDVLAELRRRDVRDATRRTAPLMVPPDALLLDTTRLDFEAAVAAVRSFIDERAARALPKKGRRGIGAT